MHAWFLRVAPSIAAEMSSHASVMRGLDWTARVFTSSWVCPEATSSSRMEAAPSVSPSRRTEE
jgi:hypothetical protein